MSLNFILFLERQRKQAAKVAKAQEEDDKNAKIKLIEKVIVAAAQETYPTTPEEREKYFMEQVAAGEALCGQGKLNGIHVDRYHCINITWFRS